MARRYSSFLIRCWRAADVAQRIEVAHIQSGERAVVRSLAIALAWVAARTGDPGEGGANRPTCRDDAGTTPRIGEPMAERPE